MGCIYNPKYIFPKLNLQITISTPKHAEKLNIQKSCHVSAIVGWYAVCRTVCMLTRDSAFCHCMFEIISSLYMCIRYLLQLSFSLLKVLSLVGQICIKSLIRSFSFTSCLLIHEAQDNSSRGFVVSSEFWAISHFAYFWTLAQFLIQRMYSDYRILLENCSCSSRLRNYHRVFKHFTCMYINIELLIIQSIKWRGILHIKLLWDCMAYVSQMLLWDFIRTAWFLNAFLYV